MKYRLLDRSWEFVRSWGCLVLGAMVTGGAVLFLITLGLRCRYLLFHNAVNIRSGQTINDASGKPIKIRLPEFKSIYSVPEQTLARRLTRVMKKNPHAALDLYRIVVRQRPAAYQSLLHKALRAFPDDAPLYVVATISALAETGYLKIDHPTFQNRWGPRFAVDDIGAIALAQLRRRSDSTPLQESLIEQARDKALEEVLSGRVREGKGLQASITGKTLAISVGHPLDSQFWVIRKRKLPVRVY